LDRLEDRLVEKKRRPDVGRCAMKKMALPLILALLLVSAVVLAAQMSPEISWWTVDGGAETSVGDGFSLSGIIGQPEAGPAMTDDTYTVTGGYWHAALKEAPPQEWDVFLPIVQR
jgi:hypothetical protein